CPRCGSRGGWGDPARATSPRPPAGGRGVVRPCGDPARGAGGRAGGWRTRTLPPGCRPPRRAPASTRQGTGDRAAPATRVRSPRRRAHGALRGRRFRSRPCVPPPASPSRLRNTTRWRSSTTASLTRSVLHACHGACDRWRIRATSATAYGMVTDMESVTRRLAALAATLAVVLAAPMAGAAQVPPARFGDGVCAISDSTCGSPPMLAIVSAFPAELEAVLSHATVHETLVIGDRVLRVGTIGDVPAVFALLGIGLVNAGTTADLVLDHFDVAGVVLSGVAGSATHAIGDVTVPATWLEANGTSHPVDPSFLQIAGAVAPGVVLERCGAIPPAPPRPITRLPPPPPMGVGGPGDAHDPLP